MLEGPINSGSDLLHGYILLFQLTCLLSDPGSSHRRNQSRQYGGCSLLLLPWRDRSKIANYLLCVSIVDASLIGQYTDTSNVCNTEDSSGA